MFHSVNFIFPPFVLTTTERRKKTASVCNKHEFTLNEWKICEMFGLIVCVLLKACTRVNNNQKVIHISITLSYTMRIASSIFYSTHSTIMQKILFVFFLFLYFFISFWLNSILSIFISTIFGIKKYKFNGKYPFINI